MSNSEPGRDVNDGPMLVEPRNGEPRQGTGFVPAAKLPVAAEALKLLPKEFIKRHRVLPWRIRNGVLSVATAEPGDQRIIDGIRLLSGLEVEETIAPATEILERIAE